MQLTCGHTAPAPKFTGSQIFAAKTAGQILTADLMLTCPAGHGLVDVAQVETVAVAGGVDPWTGE